MSKINEIIVHIEQLWSYFSKMKEMKKNQVKEWNEVAGVQTFANMDICRWGFLPTGMFADGDVCQWGHFPLGTFVNGDICQRGRLHTQTFANRGQL